MVAVARSPKAIPDPVTFFQGAADSAAVCQMIASSQWDAVVVTLTPTEFSDRAYDIAYVQTLRRLIDAWRQSTPGLILFASSTSVYPQSEGEWVNEETEVAPVSFSGKRMLQAEELLHDSGLPYCIVRFAGIYGPGRDALLRQVKNGQGGSDSFSNRIHADDAAGFICHLIEQHWGGGELAPIYLACDSHPARGREVRLWLAEQLGLNAADLTSSVSERGGNKRCSNQRLLSSGYALRYPSYVEGYTSVLGASDNASH